LDPCTSQKVSSNKEQTCQKWNFDLHGASPQFPSYRQKCNGKARASLH
jgi:hypothetical protein